jgi:hypothetical protein
LFANVDNFWKYLAIVHNCGLGMARFQEMAK